MSPQRAVLFDRDGTLVAERHYLSDPDQLELLPGTAGGMRRLRELGIALVVVTNQSAVGRGLIDAARLDEIHRRLRDLLEAEGVRLDGIYSCPHTPADDCACRKPRTGLAERAAEELKLDLRRSFVVGDKACDLELGRRIGATRLLVLTGYGERTRAEAAAGYDHLVDDVAGAARLVASLDAAPAIARVVPDLEAAE